MLLWEPVWAKFGGHPVLGPGCLRIQAPRPPPYGDHLPTVIPRAWWRRPGAWPQHQSWAGILALPQEREVLDGFVSLADAVG